MRTHRPILSLAIVMLFFWVSLLLLVVLQARSAACDWLLAAVLGEEGNREVYIARESAPELRNLTNSPLADDYDPIWSPTGDYLAVVSEQLDTRVIHLKLVNMANGESRSLAEAVPYHAYHAAWSPDGRYLALRKQGEGLAIFDMLSAGQIATLDSDSFHNLPVAWSSDSRRIAYTSPDTSAAENTERWRILATDIERGETAQLASFSFDINGSEARRPYWLYWLPDDRIVVTRQYPGSPEYAIYTLDPNVGQLELLVDHIATLGRPALAASSHLLYSTARDLHELDLDSAALRPLTATRRRDGIFEQAILPPGDVITYNTYQQPGTIYWMDIRYGRTHALLNEPRLESFAWSTECL